MIPAPPSAASRCWAAASTYQIHGRFPAAYVAASMTIPPKWASSAWHFTPSTKHSWLSYSSPVSTNVAMKPPERSAFEKARGRPSADRAPLHTSRTQNTVDTSKTRDFSIADRAMLHRLLRNEPASGRLRPTGPDDLLRPGVFPSGLCMSNSRATSSRYGPNPRELAPRHVADAWAVGLVAGSVRLRVAPELQPKKKGPPVLPDQKNPNGRKKPPPRAFPSFPPLPPSAPRFPRPPPGP